jgi:uncharacterized protein (DUF2132 family)
MDPLRERERYMSQRQTTDPLHGITLKVLLTKLVDWYGWEELGRSVDIRCFTHAPTVDSSLKFLRRTPWARGKVEELYLLWKIRHPDAVESTSIGCRNE